MEQLQAELQRIKEEFKNLKVLATSIFNSAHTQQHTRQRLHSRPELRGLSTKNLEHPFLNAFSQFERKLEEFSQKIASTSPSSSPSSSPVADSPSAGSPTAGSSTTASSSSASGSPTASSSTTASSSSASGSPTASSSTTASSSSASGSNSADPPSPSSPTAGSSATAPSSSPSASPPSGSHSADSPSAGSPATDAPSATAPSSSPSAGSPSGSPSTDAPSATAPSSSPSAGSPSGSPSTDASSATAPSDSPSASSPSLGPPSTNAPSGYSPTASICNVTPKLLSCSRGRFSVDTSFALRPSDLGEHLIRKLQTFVQSEHFTGKLLVEDIGLSSTDLAGAVQPSPSLGLNPKLELRHQLDGDTWHLHTHTLDKFQLPDLSNVESPSENPEQYLEDLYRNLPEGPIPYYVGPLSGSVAERLQSYFPSGEEVCRLGRVPGVSTLFGHVGGEASGTAFHCEDANLRSYNLTLVGWKIWVLIKPHHTTHFEDLVRRLTNYGAECDQFVRHPAVVIPPSRLRAEQIEFDIIYSGPGEMVLTQPRQYHAVINRTASFAIATNFVLPGEDPIPKRLPVCPLDGFYHLEHQMIRKIRGTRLREEAAPSRTKRPSQDEPLLQSKKPRLDRPLDIVEHLVRGTTSREAILRFMAVVRAWRGIDDDFRGRLLQIGKCDETYRPEALDTLRIAFQEKSDLFSFLEVLTSVHLVRNLERRHGISTIASEAIDRLLEIRGLENNKTNRKCLRNNLNAYKKWDQLCGEPSQYTHEGILCFVPSVFKVGVSRTEVGRLKKSDLARFSAQLQEVDYVQHMCEVGRAFQMGIFGSAEFQKRPFEQTESELSTLGLADLLQLL